MSRATWQEALTLGLPHPAWWRLMRALSERCIVRRFQFWECHRLSLYKLNWLPHCLWNLRSCLRHALIRSDTVLCCEPRVLSPLPSPPVQRLKTPGYRCLLASHTGHQLFSLVTFNCGFPYAMLPHCWHPSFRDGVTRWSPIWWVKISHTLPQGPSPVVPLLSSVRQNLILLSKLKPPAKNIGCVFESQGIP